MSINFRFVNVKENYKKRFLSKQAIRLTEEITENKIELMSITRSLAVEKSTGLFTEV